MADTELILSAIRNDKEYKDIVYELEKQKKFKNKLPIMAQGLCDGSLEAFMAAICRDISDIAIIGEKEKAVIITGDEKTAAKLQNSLAGFFDVDRVLNYPKKDFIFMNIGSLSNPFEYDRINTLKKISDGNFDVVITTLDAALQYTIPKDKLRGFSYTLEFGGNILEQTGSKNLTEFYDKLVTMGYSRAEAVEETGKFSVRGGIIDIFPPSEEYPIRLELFGEEIDSMGIFDPLTQRRIENIKKFMITPAVEVILDANARERCIEMLEGLIGGKANKNINIDEGVTDRLGFELDSFRNGEDINSKDRFISHVYAENECLLDFFDKDSTTMFIIESPKIRERQKVVETILTETVVDLIEKGYIDGKNARYSQTLEDFEIYMTMYKTIIADTFVSGLNIQLAGLFSFSTRSSPHLSEGFNILKDDLASFSSSGYKSIVFLNSDAGIKSLSDTLTDSEIKHIITDIDKYSDITSMPDGLVIIIKTPKSLYKDTAVLCDVQGFELPKQKFVLITDNNFTSASTSNININNANKAGDVSYGAARMRSGRVNSASKKLQSQRQRIMSYTDLSLGDYVVHANHGIGIYAGIERLDVSGGVQKDFIKIKYQGEDVLYVPCNQLDMVSKFIGARSLGEDSVVKLSKMGSSNWQKTKARVKAAAKDLAGELIKLYAQRQLKKGYAFSEETEWQKDFESLFEYTETDDQLTSINQIKEDMQKQYPMDRLLCGDVGFGKTEVALRAVFKCVADSKQAAVLVPTTILAWQHYQTIISRFREFPMKIEMLSRFRSRKEQEEIIKKLRTGQVDIIVGTHRIVQKDIKFSDLGLLVVDEEQRFGVSHKEKLKQLAENIDVLTLTATPIPRTLNMALSGIRDMSVIEEAPQNRIPVQTYIFEYDENIIAEAIKNELRRNGQVFYLHNRVDTIEQTAIKVAKLAEGARIGIAHGKMDETSLSKVWQDMVSGNIDILVCTTIIESGIDIPDANTLIVENADKLGLSQLHQIRGRIGRSSRRAFAYLTYPKNKVLTEIATKRLQAIREYTEFGAGFKIAMRDLEIRGAGNLLGSEQHGQMEAVGYDLYVKILEKAVNEEKKKFELIKNLENDGEYEVSEIQELLAKRSDGELEPTECLVDVAVDAFIPNKYIESDILRVEIYKRIAAIETHEDAFDLKDELIDRFGNIPVSTENLVDIALIRNSACAEYIDSIVNKDRKAVIMYLSVLAKPNGIKVLEKWTIAAAKLNGRLMLSMGQKPHVTYYLQNGESIITALKEIFKVLKET